MTNPLQQIFRRVRAAKSKEDIEEFHLTDGYVFSEPSPQNAVDLIPGWNHAFPSELGIQAGPAHMYEDGRIHWAIEQFGPIAGRRILELGPLEGSHSMMLDRHGPEVLDAVEANKKAFLRCLIAKEIFGLQRARFHLGDFVKWLERKDPPYDLIVACGVLYHMEEPLRLLELLAARTDNIYFWTHYFDETAMPPEDLRRVPFKSQKPPYKELCHEVAFHGRNVTLHERSYYGAWKKSAYCGGPVNRHYWMEKEDLLAVLRVLGFDDLRIAHDDPQHVNGPSFSVFARRTVQQAER